MGGHAADGREKKIKNYLHKKGEKKEEKRKIISQFFSSIPHDIESERKVLLCEVKIPGIEED